MASRQLRETSPCDVLSRIVTEASFSLVLAELRKSVILTESLRGNGTGSGEGGRRGWGGGGEKDILFLHTHEKR